MKFHDGSPFTADDVVFSAERARGPARSSRRASPPNAKVVKVDDHTVDFVLASPNPILHHEWETWLIVLQEHGPRPMAPRKAQPATATRSVRLALKANGTGPFMIASHEPGVKTVLSRNPDWWGKPHHNLDRGRLPDHQVRRHPRRRLAVGRYRHGRSGAPAGRRARAPASANATVLTGPELRIIFLNMDSFRDELLYSSVKGKNPFKDARVRKAFYQAIDIEAINDQDHARHVGQADAPDDRADPVLRAPAEFKRHPFDVAAAKPLMPEAGYANGFELAMDCPNDRYVNDELICQAVSAMLARIGVKITLNVMPKTRYFEKIGPTSKYNSSFNLLGWSANTLDSWNVLANLVVCRDATGKGGTFNFGGYCNPRIDQLTAKILVESDQAQRDAMIAEAFRLLHEDVGMIPLHQQSLAWGVAKGVSVVQRADGHLRFEWVQKALDRAALVLSPRATVHFLSAGPAR